MTVLEKIKEMFGENFIIKSKQVEKMVNEELVEYIDRSLDFGFEIHMFKTNKTRKTGGREIRITLKAVKTSDGVYWIQK